jgi:hypothetical protein
MEEQFIFSKEILYLGHMIGVEGVKVHQEKIHTILDWPTPISLTDLRGFFKIYNYYRRFVKGFSQLVAPLTNLTMKGGILMVKGHTYSIRQNEEGDEHFPSINTSRFHTTFCPRV